MLHFFIGGRETSRTIWDCHESTNFTRGETAKSAEALKRTDFRLSRITDSSLRSHSSTRPAATKIRVLRFGIFGGKIEPWAPLLGSTGDDKGTWQSTYEKKNSFLVVND
jgi:hypothetical protein